MFSLVFSFLQRPLFHYGNVQYREFSIFANVLEQSKRLLNLTPTGLVWNTNVAAVALFLAHQYGRHDVMWKRFIVRQIQNKIDVNEVLWARETKQPHKPLFSLKPLDTKPSWVDLTLSQPYSGSIQKRTTNPSPLAIWIFSNGLSYEYWSKLDISFSFVHCLNEFYDVRQCCWSFSEGLANDFCSRSELSVMFLFGHNWAINLFCDCEKLSKWYYSAVPKA